MRLVYVGLFGVLLAGLSGCSRPVSGDGSDDQARWQGTWKLISVTENGELQSDDMEWVVDGDHYNIVVRQVRHDDPYNITLDPRHGQVDVFHHDTPAGMYGGKLKGIYKVSTDHLTVCYDLTGATYPDSFDASRGSRRALVEFQREQ